MEFNLYRNDFKKEEAHLINPLTLAFIGDGVYEIFIRTYLCSKNKNLKIHELHIQTVEYVKAKAQSNYAKKIIDLLEEDELAVFKRGRNTKSGVPKNANVGEYRWATGFEAVIGYLYIAGRNERLNFLLGKIIEVDGGNNDEG